MRYIGHFLCVSYELHRDLRSYMGWEVHRGSGGEFLCEVWAWRPRRPWRAHPPLTAAAADGTGTQSLHPSGRKMPCLSS